MDEAAARCSRGAATLLAARRWYSDPRSRELGGGIAHAAMGGDLSAAIGATTRRRRWTTMTTAGGVGEQGRRPAISDDRTTAAATVGDGLGRI